MIGLLLNLTDNLSPLSMFGCLKLASVGFFIYYIYTKTSTPTHIARLLTALNISIYYRLPLHSLTNLTNELTGALMKNNANNNEDDHATKYEKKLPSHGTGVENMLEVTPHAKRKPYSLKFDWGVYFPHLAQALRTRKYAYPQVSYAVQKDAELQRAVKQAAEQILREQRIQSRLEAARNNESLHLLLTQNNNESNHTDAEQDTDNFEIILKQQERRAVALLKGMRSTLNNFLLSLTSWLLYKLLPCFISGVVTHTAQIEMLREAEARSPGIPLIFLPLHRSHLDYIMCTFILTNHDIKSPIVAAGDNLKIPVFGGLLRGLGAFYIKRKMDPVAGKKDVLYRAILQLYLQHALRQGHNVEFFIEGGRTRTGKPCMPKGGILSVIVNAFMDHSIPDALLVPVSINYERLVDGNFVREQKGEKKEPESFYKAICSIWKALNSKYGLMRIDFNKPYSIRELVNTYNQLGKEEFKIKPSQRQLKHNQSTSSLYGTDVVCEEHRNLIESVSRQVVYDCAAATSVMSTNALAFLLLTRYRNGASVQTLANALTKLRIELKGHRDLGFAGESIDIVNYACDIFGEKLIKRIKIPDQECAWIEIVGGIDSFIELCYYSNMLAPHFALQSILLRTFKKLLHRCDEVTIKSGLSRKRLIDAAIENSAMFRYEFILHKPTETLEDVLNTAVDELIGMGNIGQIEKQLPTKTAELSRRFAKVVDYALGDSDDDDYDEPYNNKQSEDDGDKLLLCKDADKVEDQEAICNVLAPFCHTYLAVAQSLYMLYRNTMLESDFIKLIIKDLTNKVQKGDCPFAESISTDSVRNCIKLLEKWSVIEINNHEGMRILSLASLYDLSRESLKSVVQRFTTNVPKTLETTYHTDDTE